MLNKFVCSIAVCAILAFPAFANGPEEVPELSDETITGSFWGSSETGGPTQFFTESELKKYGLMKEAPPLPTKPELNSGSRPGNKYNMPPIMVRTSGVVYKKVPQTDHRRRSLASRGAHSVQTAPTAAYKTVAVREPINLDITPIICKYAEKHNLDPWLVRAVIEVESNFCPTAGSYAGAGGLMQLMPATASSLGCRDRFDPEANIAAGTRYLRQMCNMFPNDIRLAIAAYNAGPGNVQRYGGIPPFAETRNYVVKVTRIWKNSKAKATKN